nr:histidine kinase [Motilibacter aurantiacus]
MAGVTWSSFWYWSTVRTLDEARRRAAQAELEAERLRFAADLHDVQGHHLQVIALKAELVSRLIEVDPAAARREADEVRALAAQTLADTRAVVRDYRRVGLATEVDNAVAVLRSAGVDAVVDGDATLVPTALQGAAGHLIREGTTNVLRHARARRVRVSLHCGHEGAVVAIEDDGAPTAGRVTRDGTGIAGLRERFAALGGDVEAVPLPERGFRLEGRLPMSRA